MFAVMRFLVLLKLCPTVRLPLEELEHPQTANGTDPLVTFDSATKNSSNNMVAFGSAHDEGYMVSVFEKPLGHHRKLWI